MKKSFLLPLLIFSLLISSASAGRHHRRHHHSQKKVFVFGDSYVDTGNWNKVAGISWKSPYGRVFPGIPAGRFSDGRVLTDFVASYFHIRSPIPYVRRNMLPNAKTQFGMNFAYGGTGVFDTYVPLPNMTSQIDLFKDVIAREKVYTNTDLRSSIALVSLAGNDYATFRLHEPPSEDLIRFIKSVVHQLILNLKHIHNLGVPKIAVTTLPPLGCLPITTFRFGHKNCSSRQNEVSAFHNRLLREGLECLNKQTREPAFFILDLYDAFLFALQGHKIQSAGNLEYKNPLKQCCQGVTGDYDCGSIEGGEAKYTVCNNPQKAFFWDTVHLTQHGWHQVYLAIQPTLRKLL